MFKYLLIILTACATSAFAEPAMIKNVSIVKNGGTYTFDVTISHGDTGWDHYADAWRITDGNGTVLGKRELAHPHVNEQPLTRSLSGVRIPEGITTVTIEVRDTLSGWSPMTRQVKIK